MPEEYMALVDDMKAMTREGVTLKVAEDEWNTRPDDDSYGEISLEFEADHFDGDNQKQAEAHEGSFDLYSVKRDGDGWIPLIREILTTQRDSCWRLNSHAYENKTRLFHWEWVFQIEG